jgi:hypothetical protein
MVVPTYAVEFDKILTKSRYANGLTIHDRIRFVDRDDAVSWIESVQKFDRGAVYTGFEIKEIAC